MLGLVTRQFDLTSLPALLSALAIFSALVAFALSSNFGSVSEEAFSAAMRGESNGETGADTVVLGEEYDHKHDSAVGHAAIAGIHRPGL